ncbi:putative gamma-butyrobetaine dioxygenase [Trichoplax sp. H2]|nr:putative gamma-butyrobetaine dioxygenase [Trichoplax sp. H2]|eukprot:RDD42513.1 putative gamma-butyrobetaine dioxygenase [Trichoplax sp. H2]
MAKWISTCIQSSRHLRRIGSPLGQERPNILFQGYRKQFLVRRQFNSKRILTAIVNPHIRDTRRLLSGLQLSMKSTLASASENLINESPLSRIMRDGNELQLVMDNQQYRQHGTNACLIESHTLPQECKLASADLEEDDVVLRWQGEDDHVGRISRQFLRDHSYSKDALSKRNDQSSVKTFMAELPRIKFEEIYRSKESQRKFLMKLFEYGCCLVQDTPIKAGAIEEMLEPIAPVQPTIYGKIFDLMAVPNPTHIAYSMAPLIFHMDLLYYESPPGIQALHCIRFDECVTGGESRILDSFLIAEEFRRDFPEDFEILTRIPVAFQRVHLENDNPVAMVYRRPHIVLNHNQEIIAVNWSPGFEGPLSIAEEYVEPYYRARRKFADIVENSQYEVEHRLQPGEMLMFNNRRMMHARREFTLNGGIRHLQGIYLNMDVFRSQTIIANLSAGINDILPRIGNQCYS